MVRQPLPRRTGRRDGRPSSSRSSSCTSSARSRERSAATSARRVASPAPGEAASPAASATSWPWSSSRAAASSASKTAHRSGQVSPSNAPSAARSCSERKGSFWKSESSQRSSASAEPGSPSAPASAASDVDRDRRPERVQPRRLARWLRRSDGKHRSDAERAPVERLEEHRARRESRRRRQPERADGVRDLLRRVGRSVTGIELDLKLEDAVAIRLLAEPSGRRPLDSGQCVASSPGREGRTTSPAASSTCVGTVSPTSGASARVAPPLAEERLLERRVRLARTPRRPSRTRRTRPPSR